MRLSEVVKATSSIQAMPQQEQKKLISRKKRASTISMVAGGLGASALAARVPAAARVASNRSKRVASLKSVKRLVAAEPKATAASNTLTTLGAGIGATGSFNFAALQRQERKADEKTIAKNVAALGRYRKVGGGVGLRNVKRSVEAHDNKVTEWAFRQGHAHGRQDGAWFTHETLRGRRPAPGDRWRFENVADRRIDDYVETAERVKRREQLRAGELAGADEVMGAARRLRNRSVGGGVAGGAAVAAPGGYAAGRRRKGRVRKRLPSALRRAMREVPPSVPKYGDPKYRVGQFGGASFSLRGFDEKRHTQARYVNARLNAHLAGKQAAAIRNPNKWRQEDARDSKAAGGKLSRITSRKIQAELTPSGKKLRREGTSAQALAARKKYLVARTEYQDELRSIGKRLPSALREQTGRGAYAVQRQAAHRVGRDTSRLSAVRAKAVREANASFGQRYPGFRDRITPGGTRELTEQVFAGRSRGRLLRTGSRRELAKADDRFLRSYRDRISPGAERGYEYLRGGRNAATREAAYSGAMVGVNTVGYKLAPRFFGAGSKSSKVAQVAHAGLGGVNAYDAYRHGRKAVRWNKKMGKIKARARTRADAGLYGVGRGKEPVDPASRAKVGKALPRLRPVRLPRRVAGVRSGGLVRLSSGRQVTRRGAIAGTGALR